MSNKKGDGSGIGEHNSDPAKNSTASKDLPTCGDPIDVSTGRMVLTQTDVDIAAVSSPCRSTQIASRRARSRRCSAACRI